MRGDAVLAVCDGVESKLSDEIFGRCAAGHSGDFLMRSASVSRVWHCELRSAFWRLSVAIFSACMHSSAALIARSEPQQSDSVVTVMDGGFA